MSSVHHAQAIPGRALGGSGGTPPPQFDYWLLGAAVLLLTFGLIMVASASLHLGDEGEFSPFHYVMRHGFAIAIGVICSALIAGIPLQAWEKASTLLYFLALLLLVLVLVPGVGKTVNGATRWIPLGPLNFQSSELMKLFAVVYIAGYLVRRRLEVAHSFWGFVKPTLLLVIACALIIAQPDFGTAAVLLATVLGMLFLGGVAVWQFGLLISMASVTLAGLVYFSPYRLQRIATFLNPWDDPFGSGYQLTQALIAFGRGEWFGVGLGNGIQKQFYLPEAHTDFLMAVVGEEFGLAGTLAVILLFSLIVWRAFRLGVRAERAERRFSAYVAYGFGLWIGLQAYINIGVNVGLLPTKGLTLPLMSYGSNSIVVACIVITLLLRIDFETRRAEPAKAMRKVPWSRA